MAPLFTNFHFGFGRPPGVSGPLPNVEATGGNTAVSGGYKYHVISSSGSFQVVSNPESKKFEAFLIGGGGGGGNGGDMWGGGGGAGGAVHIGTQYGFPLGTSTYPITIGAGGAATNKGGDTTFAAGSTIVADGGGYGSGRQCVPNAQGQPGGSAGGAGIEGGAGNANQPTRSNPAPAQYGVTQFGGQAHGNNSASGGWSAKPWTDSPTVPNPTNKVSVLCDSPIGSGAIGFPGTAPGATNDSGNGNPANVAYGPYPQAYGSGGFAKNGNGGTGASGCVVIRYAWNE